MRCAVRLYSYSYLVDSYYSCRSVCLALRLEYLALSVLHTYGVFLGIWDELEPSRGLADAHRRLRVSLSWSRYGSD